MKVGTRLFALAAASVLLGGFVAPQEVSAAPAVNSSSANAVRKAYQRFEVLKSIKPQWSGDADRCKVGAVSSAFRNAGLESINIMRGIAGLEPVRLDASLNAKAAKAALIMHANENLSHRPPKGWKCWSKDGYEAASHSNLAWGFSGARAVAGYMEDYGAHNTDVGHRRWLLRPNTRVLGMGDTDNYNAIYVFGSPGDVTTKKWVSWPSEGYFPQELNSQRWSLSAPEHGYSFRNAQVRVTAPNGSILSTPVIARDGFYGNPALVWEMPTLAKVSGGSEQRYLVTVSGIRNPRGSTVQKSYAVRFINGSYVAATNGQFKAHSAGTKIQSYATNTWGTVPGCSSCQTWTEVKVNGHWSRSQRRQASPSGRFVIPLTYGRYGVGAYEWRVGAKVNGKTIYSNEFTLERQPRVYFRTANSKRVGQVSNSWGRVYGCANTSVWTQVVVNGRWSTSQRRVTSASESFVIPLTYGATTPGWSSWRAVSKCDGRTYVSETQYLYRYR